MPFTLPSYAKINWSLRVLGKRDDGFHELFTTFQTVSLHDTLHFERAASLTLKCDDPAVPLGESNLIVQAGALLNRDLGTSYGAEVTLEKRIPFPGGLGGGSSNAAVALIGLARLWEVTVRESDLRALASELGSDVPYFLTGGTAVGTGRGEIIVDADEISQECLLIVTPSVHVSTPEVFGRLEADSLTSESQKRILSVSRNEVDRLDPLLSELKNDLEPSVFAAHPEVKRVKDTLLDLGAANAAMSGSGGSVFAVFDNKETRRAAQKALETESTWRKFAVSTISRSQYREALDL